MWTPTWEVPCAAPHSARVETGRLWCFLEDARRLCSTAEVNMCVSGQRSQSVPKIFKNECSILLLFSGLYHKDCELGCLGLKWVDRWKKAGYKFCGLQIMITNDTTTSTFTAWVITQTYADPSLETTWKSSYNSKMMFRGFEFH